MNSVSERISSPRNLKLTPMGVYRHFVQDSLYRNSIYLLINLGITTAAGFLFVVICTRLYSQKQVGYATALMGALALATAIADLGMSRTILRFLAKSTTKSQDLVTKLLLVSGASLVIGLAFSLCFHAVGIKQANLVTALLFTAAVLFGTTKTLFDNVFIASRASEGTLIESTLFSLTRLIFPIIVVGSGFIGIFSANLVGAVVAVIASVLLLRGRQGFRFIRKPSRQSMEGKWGFTLGSWTSDLIGGLPVTILPVIVVARLGPAAGALWFVSMQIVSFLLAVSSSINQAMFAEMANATGSISHFIKQALLAMYGLLIPLSAAVFVLAPTILAIFGPAYVAAEQTLRLMTVFALIGVANFLTGSILSLYKKVLYLSIVNAVNAIIVIVYCMTVAHTINGIAVGWVLGEVANFVLFVAGGLYLVVKNHGVLYMKEV
jgi:O-antigen/teichoic acid export membrane protein